MIRSTYPSYVLSQLCNWSTLLPLPPLNTSEHLGGGKKGTLTWNGSNIFDTFKLVSGESKVSKKRQIWKSRLKNVVALKTKTFQMSPFQNQQQTLEKIQRWNYRKRETTTALFYRLYCCFWKGTYIQGWSSATFILNLLIDI